MPYHSRPELDSLFNLFCRVTVISQDVGLNAGGKPKCCMSLVNMSKVLARANLGLTGKTASECESKGLTPLRTVFKLYQIVGFIWEKAQ